MIDNRSLIRTSYWVAAIVDFVIAVLVLIPDRMGVTEFVYPMGLMSAVAFSWAVLLIVADRRAIVRRWVLLPTMLVVFLLGTAGVYAATIGAVPVGRIIGSSTAVVLVLSLLAYSWFRTRRLWPRSFAADRTDISDRIQPFRRFLSNSRWRVTAIAGQRLL